MLYSLEVFDILTYFDRCGLDINGLTKYFSISSSPVIECNNVFNATTSSVDGSAVPCFSSSISAREMALTTSKDSTVLWTGQ